MRKEENREEREEREEILFRESVKVEEDISLSTHDDEVENVEVEIAYE